MNLIEGIQEELKRCRELKVVYKSLGRVGLFGIAVINQSIDRAEEAVASGDISEMIRAHRDLKKIQ